MKNTYKVPVVWSAMGYVLVDAEDGESAKRYVKDHLDEFPLPKDGEYLDDSFEVDEEGDPIMIEPVSPIFIKYDKVTRDWFDKHPEAITTVACCEKCGLYYKPTLGHKCKKRG